MIWNLIANPTALPDGLSTSDEVRQFAHELELEVHLAGMSSRDRWRVAAPRLIALEEELEESGHQLTDSVRDELAVLYALLHDLRVVLN